MWVDTDKGEGRWKERVNTETGESSIKEHILKVVKEWCAPKDHHFVLENPRSRTVVCNKCQYEAKFILGMQSLVDGKLIDISI